MAIEYLGLSEINGPLIALEGVKDAAYDEIVEFSMNDGAEKRLGRIIEIYKDKAVIQNVPFKYTYKINRTPYGNSLIT